MKIALSTDHRGVGTYGFLADLIKNLGHDLVPVPICDGTTCDYPEMAYGVGQAVAMGLADLGILVCGSGIGMSIAANKVRGVRAALCHDELNARLSRSHNNANVLCLSADMTSQRMQEQIVRQWLETEFEGGRHLRRVSKVMAIEAGEDPRTVNTTTEQVASQSG